MRKITMELLHEAIDEADDKQLLNLVRDYMESPKHDQLAPMPFELASERSAKKIGFVIAKAIQNYIAKLDRLDQERHGPDDGDSLAEEKRLDDLNRARDIQAEMRELYRGDDGEE